MVVVYLNSPDPGRNGTHVTSVDRSDGTDLPVGVIEFDGVYEIRFGGLNDEALSGHPLYGRGLEHYAAHTVVNSSWVTESERRNAVHPRHRGGWHQRLTHYILSFHDDTLECLATDLRARRVAGTFARAVEEVSQRLLI